jgi:RND family efflux transporter MFP subunit
MLKMKKCTSIYFPLLLGAVISFHGCKNRDAGGSADAKTLAVITGQVAVVPLSQDIPLSGNIEGNRTLRLGFMVAGKISQINVDEGQSVHKGQLIAALDSTNYSIAKELSDVQVNQAEDEYTRLKLMYERNSISESDFKKIGFALQGAKAQQKLHGKNLSDTRLYSPISGILLKKLAEPGEIVATGMPVLVVSDISKVKVNAYIPENQLHLIKTGQTAHVLVSALGETFAGKVIEVGGAADATTRAFTVKIELPNPGQLIRPGMIAEVSLPSSTQQQVLAIPLSAILHMPGGQACVFVADREKGQAFRRNVSLGSLYGDKVEIVSGLAAGETIVTGGQQKLTNGDKISVINK